MLLSPPDPNAPATAAVSHNTAGGCSDYATFRENPSFRLRFSVPPAAASSAALEPEPEPQLPRTTTTAGTSSSSRVSDEAVGNAGGATGDIVDELFITVHQDDQRKGGQGGPISYPHLGCYVLEPTHCPSTSGVGSTARASKENSDIEKNGESDEVAEAPVVTPETPLAGHHHIVERTSFWNSREISCVVRLPRLPTNASDSDDERAEGAAPQNTTAAGASAGAGAGRSDAVAEARERELLLVLSTYYPGVSAAFKLVVRAPSELNLQVERLNWLAPNASHHKTDIHTNAKPDPSPAGCSGGNGGRKDIDWPYKQAIVSGVWTPPATSRSKRCGRQGAGPDLGALQQYIIRLLPPPPAELVPGGKPRAKLGPSREQVRVYQQLHSFCLSAVPPEQNLSGAHWILPTFPVCA
eukprot:COSAG05_NODE_48_length_24425_cov_90.438543_31_plen_411_part_00